MVIVRNLTANRVSILHSDDRSKRIFLMPAGHEKGVASVGDEWADCESLSKMEQRGTVSVERGASKKVVGIAEPDLSAFDSKQRRMIKALVLGTDAEYGSYLAMEPLRNPATMPKSVDYRYMRDKMLPAFGVAADWLRSIKNSSRETGVRKRIVELTEAVDKARL